MNEHGAAAAGDARPRIVIEFDEDIVEGVVAAKPVAWFIGRPPERPIVTPVGRIFTPGVAGSDTTSRQQCSRMREAVGPPPQPHGTKSPARGAAVALALVRSHAGAPEGNGHGQVAGAEPALRSPPRPRTDLDPGKRSPSHGMAAAERFPPPLALLSANVLLRVRQCSKIAAGRCVPRH